MVRTIVAFCMCAVVWAGAWGGTEPVHAQGTVSGEARAALVNLNTATAADLEKLPGVGPAMALRIVEYRQKNGGFKKIEDLMNVRGIGEASFLKLKPQITVAPARVAER